MEYLDHHYQSSHNFNVAKRRRCFIDYLPPQKRTRPTQFEPVNSAITAINQASMSFTSSNGYKPYSVPVQQYQAPAMLPVRSYPLPCMLTDNPNGALPVPCMPTRNPNGALPVSCMPTHSPDGAMPVPCMPSHNPNGALPLPSSSQPTSNQQLVGTSHSDLITSLLSKGLISLPNQRPPQSRISQSEAVSSLLNSLISPAKEQTSAQDSIGLEFDQAKLKSRHEYAIRALYADLPKQCTRCGMRFKSQEEQYRLHMDRHIKKNLDAMRNKHKPKQMASRKFFLTSDLWLTAAEAVGPDKAPVFFTTNDVKEKKPEEAVFADEDQKACPLCMEPFDEYFSNETNDWMYRGAVYFEVAKESKGNLHRSLEGRIVHAKCMQ